MFMDQFDFILDVNNVQRLLVKFFLGFTIIWSIWNVCTMIAIGYLMGRKIKHCWLRTNLVKHFKMQSGVVFFLESFKGELLSKNKV
jgi:hypothetical protein